MTDFLGFIAVLAGAVEFNKQVSLGLRWLSERGRDVSETFREWHNHNLACRVRSWITLAILLHTGMFVFAVLGLRHFVAQKTGEGIGDVFWFLAACYLSALAFLLWVRIPLCGVKPIDWEHVAEVEEWRQAGSPEDHKPEVPATDEAMRKEYGFRRNLSLARCFLSFIGSFCLMALGIGGAGVLLFTAHPQIFQQTHANFWAWFFDVRLWLASAALVVLGIGEAYLAIAAWAVTALVVGRSIAEGADFMSRALNVLLRPLIVALPNITNENYDRVVGQFHPEKPFKSLGATLEPLHVPLVGGLAIWGAFVLLLPHALFDISMLVILLVAGMYTYPQRKADMDEEVKRNIQRGLRAFSGILLLMGVARLLATIVMVYHDHLQEITPSLSFRHRLLAISWGEWVVIAALALFGVWAASRVLPEPGWLRKILSFGLGALALASIVFALASYFSGPPTRDSEVAEADAPIDVCRNESCDFVADSCRLADPGTRLEGQLTYCDWRALHARCPAISLVCKKYW